MVSGVALEDRLERLLEDVAGEGLRHDDVPEGEERDERSCEEEAVREKL